MNLLEWLLQGTIPVGGGVLRVPAVLGNVFGLALLAVSVYGRVRWARAGRDRSGAGSGAITPQWAGRRNLVGLVAVAAVMYFVYALSCLWGFATWVKARRRLVPGDDAVAHVGAAA